MPEVLAWIVAVERHTPTEAGAASPLDFAAPVAQRALQWAEWLVDQPGVRLLLNASVRPDADEAQRITALQPRLLNPEQAHRADHAALNKSLLRVKKAPATDTLLLLWLGHGVLRDDVRYLVVQDAMDAASLQSWQLPSLLRSLRGGGPGLQIGVIDACAELTNVDPGGYTVPGAGKAQRRQHFYLAATAGARASLSLEKDTLASLALQQLQAQPWPPRIEAFDPALRRGMQTLPSLPFAWEFTEGSGDSWSRPDRSARRDDDRWALPLAALGLSPPQWMELAALVGQDAGRTAPRCGSVGEVLAWAAGLADPQGADRALLALVVGALRMARGQPPQACADLRARIAADARLAPLLPAVEAALPPLDEALVLMVELDLPEEGGAPLLRRHWLLRHGQLEPGLPLALQGAVGDQLNALVAQVRAQHAGALRVELLAPLALLAGHAEWTRYRWDPQDEDSVQLDAYVPICWRWRERMMGRDPRYQTQLWRHRAQAEGLRVGQRVALCCRFDDDPADATQPADVFALAWTPPGPGQGGPERVRFRTALLSGHPYMLWPGAAPVDAAALKARVRAWLEQQTLLRLPESHRAAREDALWPHLVLFLDEPERNPYDAAQPGFTTAP